VIAHKSSTNEIMELRKAFDQFDSANNGTISFEEFKAAMLKTNFPEDQVQEIFQSIVSGWEGVSQFDTIESGQCHVRVVTQCRPFLLY
jgi:Ca2+-binding EF-hand superfamily protein